MVDITPSKVWSAPDAQQPAEAGWAQEQDRLRCVRDRRAPGQSAGRHGLGQVLDRYFASSAHRTTWIVSAVVLVAAALAKLPFVTSAWARVARAGRPSVSPLLVAAAGVAAVGFVAGGARWAAVPGAEDMLIKLRRVMITPEFPGTHSLPPTR